MKTWRNFETMNPTIKHELILWLKKNDIYYEVSECFDGWHFEILCDNMECEDINRFLDALYELYDMEA